MDSIIRTLKPYLIHIRNKFKLLIIVENNFYTKYGHYGIFHRCVTFSSSVDFVLRDPREKDNSEDKNITPIMKE